jgi:hypothetical protein
MRKLDAWGVAQPFHAVGVQVAQILARYHQAPAGIGVERLLQRRVGDGVLARRLLQGIDAEQPVDAIPVRHMVEQGVERLAMVLAKRQIVDVVREQPFPVPEQRRLN